MVGGHQLHGLGAEVAHAIKRALVQDHSAKAQIVAQGRDQSAAAGDQAGRGEISTARRVILQAYSCRAAQIAGGEAVLLFRGHAEVGIVHTKRGE